MTRDLPNIALVGKAGAGKTSAAGCLVREFGYTRLSFATPLKLGVGSTADRELLQRVGVGVRELAPDFWVNLLLAAKKIREYAVFGRQRFVVDDCRFPNELHALQSEGFVSIRVRANRNARLARLQANGKLTDEAQLEHVSETALDESIADWSITNAGSPEELRADLIQVLNWLQR